jgi:hypothetical protein
MAFVSACECVGLAELGTGMGGGRLRDETGKHGRQLHNAIL